MSSRILRIMENLDSRFPTRQEQEEVLRYASSLPGRFRACQLIEQFEKEAIRATIDRLKKKYPNFGRLHGAAWEKAERDMQLVVRAMTQGLLLDDPEVPVQKVYFWLRSILASLGMTGQFNRDTYSYLRDAYSQYLPEEVFALFRPHLEQAISVISDVPEPAVPAV